MENQKKDQLVYEIDLNAPTIFSMVNEAKVNPEKANAAISLDYIGNAGDGGAWTMRLEQGDKLGDFVDRVPFGVLDKTITGLGATTLELETQVRDSIIVVPTKSLAYNKHLTTEQRMGRNSSMYIGSPIGNILTDITIEDIQEYLGLDNGKRKKFLVVADSLWKVIKAIGPRVYHDYFLMVDEIDTMQSDSVYRPNLEKVIDYYFRFDRTMRAAVTATLRTFSDERLLDESYVTTVWEHNPVRDIRLIEAREVDVMAEKVIRNLLERSEAEKILVAYNSLDGILNIINIISQGKHPEYRQLCGVLCSGRNQDKVKDYVENVLDENNNLQKRIVFMTCAYFAGIDINDRCHVISISSNYQPFTLLSPERLTQIQGRCRNGVLSETIIYDITPMENTKQTLKEYKTVLINKAKKFSNAVDGLNQLCKSDPNLSDMGVFVEQILTMKAEGQVAKNYPVTIIRKNIDGKIVPAYFNIDALLEKWELHHTLYSQSGALLEKLKEQHHVDFEQSEQEKSGRHIGSIQQVKAYNKEVLAQTLSIAKEALLNWEHEGANMEALDGLMRSTNRQEVLFYTRFKRLYPYFETEFLVDKLIELQGDKREFMSLNNSLIFWALDDTHAFKSHVLAKFECEKLTQGPIRIRQTERTVKMKEVIDAYFKGLKLDRTAYPKLFTQFFNAKSKTRRTGIYRITSLNPYNYPVPKKRITDADKVNLVELFVWPNRPA